MFRAIVGKAKLLLAQGKVIEEVLEILMNELFPKPKSPAPKLIIKKKKEERAYISKAGRLIWKLNPPLKRSLKKKVNYKQLTENFEALE